MTVHDVRREATTNLCEMGATWAESAREVGLASQAVFTSLPSPAEMETTVLDPDNGILTGLLTGGAYIDLTTNAPDVVRRIAEVCLSRGIEMLDAPVSGRPPRMTVMAGGDAETFEKYRPVFENMAGNVSAKSFQDCGQDVYGFDQCIDLGPAGAIRLGRRIIYDKGYSDGFLVKKFLIAKIMIPEVVTVIAGENDQCIFHPSKLS